jgi:RNA polymerase sigma-70 factor (ECF subfamily)
VDIVYVQDAPAPAASFADLYRAHSHEVWKYALALTGNPAQADDFTAEAFLRIWQVGDRVRLSTVKAYLLAIVRNLYRSQWRQAGRQEPLPDVLTARTMSPDIAIELAETLARLQELNETERSALLLRAEHGLSYAEIAAMLGSSEGAVRTHVFRARERLRELRNMPCPKK